MSSLRFGGRTVQPDSCSLYLKEKKKRNKIPSEPSSGANQTVYAGLVYKHPYGSINMHPAALWVFRAKLQLHLVT